MEMMGNESVIWEGHPTWRATLSFQSPVDRIMKVGSIDFDTASDDPSDRFSFIGVNRPQDLREQIMHARDAEKTSGQHDRQGGLA